MKSEHALRWFLAMLATWAVAGAVVLGYLSRETLELVIWSLVAVAFLWVMGGGFVAPALHYMAACRAHPRERVERPRATPRPQRHEGYPVNRTTARVGREVV